MTYTMYKVLAINPGSTSTKISVAHNDKLLFVEDIKHSRDELSQFEKISDQSAILVAESPLRLTNRERR